MGGLDGRAYTGSRDPWYNTNLRYYQKHIKPRLDSQIQKDEVAVEAAEIAGDIALGLSPLWPLAIAKTIVNAVVPETRASNVYSNIKASTSYVPPKNKDPMDISGRPVYSKTYW